MDMTVATHTNTHMHKYISNAVLLYVAWMQKTDFKTERLFLIFKTNSTKPIKKIEYS